MTWKRIFFLAAAMALVAIVVSRREELIHLFRILRTGTWIFILIALALQGLYYILYILHYQAAFKSVDVPTRFGSLAAVLFAATFVNITTPTAGTAGVALIIDDLTRRGQRPARVIAGTFLAGLIDYASIAALSALGMVLLAAAHRLTIPVVIGALILLGLIVAMALVIFLGLVNPILLARLLRWGQTLGNWIASKIRKKPLFAPGWADRTADELRSAAAFIVAHPRRVLLVVSIALLSYAVSICSIWALFLAFHQDIHLSVLISGFAMGMLFWIASITPQGVGTSEGAMILAYTSLGIPLQTATVVTLAFRGFTLWLPVLLGFVLMRNIKLLKK